jgi:hypothetical protein
MRTVIPEATSECLGLFNPEAAIAKREIDGATGFREVRRRVDDWQQRLGAGSSPA